MLTERTAKKPASEFNAFPSSLLDEVRQFLERRGMSHGPAVGTAVPVPWPRVLSEGEATPRFVIRGSDLRSGFYIKLEQRRRPHDCRMSVIGAGFPGGVPLRPISLPATGNLPGPNEWPRCRTQSFVDGTLLLGFPQLYSCRCISPKACLPGV